MSKGSAEGVQEVVSFVNELSVGEQVTVKCESFSEAELVVCGVSELVYGDCVVGLSDVDSVYPKFVLQVLEDNFVYMWSPIGVGVDDMDVDDFERVGVVEEIKLGGILHKDWFKSSSAFFEWVEDGKLKS